MVTNEQPTHLPDLLELLEHATTKEHAQDLLRVNDCAHSGTWDDLKGKRFPPALKSGSITESDLIDLINSAEEHNAQHVFLYSCSKPLANKIIDDPALKKIAQKTTGSEARKIKSTLTKPTQILSLTAVRHEEINGEKTVILKFLEKRIKKGEVEISIVSGPAGKFEVRKYPLREHRTVSTVRIRETGIMEVRIGSAGKTGAAYITELKRTLDEASKHVNLERFNLMSLTKFKTEIAANLAEYNNEITLKLVSARNSKDQVLTARSGLDDSGIDGEILTALALFNDSDGQYDHSSVIFKIETDEGEPSKTPANFRGEPHEYSLTGQVTQSQYEHILRFIRKASK